MKNKILITGANGQLGNEFQQIAKSFIDADCLFHDIDTLDITNNKALSHFFITHQPTIVINCAAYTAVDKAETEFDKAELINATAVKLLVDECRKYNSYFIHISTDYVFDGKGNTPISENNPVNPISAYGRTKEKGEQSVLAYNKGMVIRTAWLYSTFGNNFVKTMMRLGKERSELKVVFDQTGTPTYAADLANAIQQIVNRIFTEPNSFIGGAYHYSNEGVCSWFDFAKNIMDECELSCKVLPIETKDYPLPAIRPVYSVFNKAKIKQNWNLSIPHWQDSLKICIQKMER